MCREGEEDGKYGLLLPGPGAEGRVFRESHLENVKREVKKRKTGPQQVP